jgi:beta-N-acetylhexosaminidase
MDEDYGYMKKGIENGTITQERLTEAVTKILALKAALKLNIKKENGTIIPKLEDALKILGCEEHISWAKECADKAITLVKEEKNILPISPQKYKKVLYYDIESGQGVAYSVRAGVADKFHELLQKEGFDIDRFDPNKGFEGRMAAYKDTTDKYDLIVYLCNMATKSNQTTVRIEWAQPMGANVPIFVKSVPTLFISVENPYHLLDVPRVKTFINTYSSTDIVLESLIDKLMGRSEFKGTNPVDPFCGRWDTKLK